MGLKPTLPDATPAATVLYGNNVAQLTVRSGTIDDRGHGAAHRPSAAALCGPRAARVPAAILMAPHTTKPHNLNHRPRGSHTLSKIAIADRTTANRIESLKYGQLSISSVGSPGEGRIEFLANSMICSRYRA